MKLSILSDLHLEFQDDPLEFLDGLRVECDVAILAGDICPIPQITPDIKQAISRLASRVIYVPGNHEYYGTSIADWPEWMPANVTMDDYRHLVVGDRKFIMTTLWYSRAAVQNIPANAESGVFIKNGRFVQFSDFRHIEHLESLVYDSNHEATLLLAQRMSSDTIVISHHLPSPRSIPEEFKNEINNAFFCCNVEDLIIKRQPKLWVHGHTHTAVDYQIGDTRVVANPHGYPYERRGKAKYQPLIVEV